MVEVNAPERVVFAPAVALTCEPKCSGASRETNCPAYHFIHFEEPKVAVAAMVLSHEGLLLVKQRRRP